MKTLCSTFINVLKMARNMIKLTSIGCKNAIALGQIKFPWHRQGFSSKGSISNNKAIFSQIKISVYTII